MSKANETQVAGAHYMSQIQHWDYVVANDLDYFQGQITKYVTRWRNKNGLQDLQKAKHFLEKYIEIATAEQKQVHVVGTPPLDDDTKQHMFNLARANAE